MFSQLRYNFILSFFLFIILFVLTPKSVLSQDYSTVTNTNAVEIHNPTFENYSKYFIYLQILSIEQEVSQINPNVFVPEKKKCNAKLLYFLLGGATLGAITGLVMTSINSEETFWPYVGAGTVLGFGGWLFGCN